MHTRYSGSPDYVRERARILRQNPRSRSASCGASSVAGFKLRRQQPLGRYIVDFCSVDGNTIVEVDGASHIGKEEYDFVRDQWLASLEAAIVHVSAKDIENAAMLPRVLNQILNACQPTGAPRMDSSVLS